MGLDYSTKTKSLMACDIGKLVFISISSRTGFLTLTERDCKFLFIRSSDKEILDVVEILVSYHEKIIRS